MSASNHIACWTSGKVIINCNAVFFNDLSHNNVFSKCCYYKFILIIYSSFFAQLFEPPIPSIAIQSSNMKKCNYVTDKVVLSTPEVANVAVAS